MQDIIYYMSRSADLQMYEITGSFPLFSEPATEATVMFHPIKTIKKQGMKEPASGIHIKAGLKS